MNANLTPHWKELLADPGPNGHIVQLYQDDEFYSEAISHFAAEGFIRDESVVLVATQDHWKMISSKLETKGFEVKTLLDRNQLTLADADGTLPKFMTGKMPDADMFKRLAHQTIKKARGGGKYPQVRWWGEMVNVLYVNGNVPGSIRLEELFDEVAHEESIAIFCSFLMDKFDSKIYEGPLGNVCRTHSHLIPTADYDHHRECVDQAVQSVFGTITGPILNWLLSSKLSFGTGMPPSQALLLGLREAAPEHFETILSAAKELERAAAVGSLL